MNILQKSIEIILKFLPQTQGIYVFGSAASDTETHESDLDIALLTEHGLSLHECFELQEKIAQKIHRDVDLIDLKKANTVFRFEIISTGKRIFSSNDDLCNEFEGLVYAMYVRFNDERADILKDIKKRGKIYE